MDADTLSLFRLAHNFFQHPEKYGKDVDHYRISGREVVSLAMLLEQGSNHAEDHDELASDFGIDPFKVKQIILNFLGHYLASSSANYYQVLGLPKNAPDGLVREQYRRLITVFHPDKTDHDPRLAALINEAYNVLKKSDKRAAYDKQLRESFRQSVKASSSGTGKTSSRRRQSDASRNSMIDMLYRIPGLGAHPRLFIWSGVILVILVVAVFPNMLKPSIKAPAYVHVSGNEARTTRPGSNQPVNSAVAGQAEEVLVEDEPVLDSLLYSFDTRSSAPDAITAEQRDIVDISSRLPASEVEPLNDAESMPEDVGIDRQAKQMPVIEDIQPVAVKRDMPNSDITVVSPDTEYKTKLPLHQADDATVKSLDFIQRVNFYSSVTTEVKIATANTPSQGAGSGQFKLDSNPPEMIFMNYIGRYESGDVDGILALVPDEVKAHDGGGKAYIQESYQELFDSTSSRQINVKELSVNPPGPSGIMLVCNLALRLEFKDESEPRLYDGVLTMRIVEGMRGQEIAEVHYDLN